ncbi:tyrosine-type recombinase/integrase [Marinifaba aquimaris]|uniref:tyrosine-type recombinase/integrase n=1 Tax=Marinifaba aquimaris TaxID=2741323 RepID=UPI001FEC4F6D|nr:site-specific integrase [Marinifaba aquimaris]
MPDLRYFTFADYLEPLIVLAMNTGMRRGELLNLKWEHVDLTQKYLTVVAGNAKSGKGRHIPLNNEAFTTLQSWAEDFGAIGYVFKGKEDAPLTDISKAWQNLLKNTEISDFRFHDLRHHFASKLVMAGADLNTVRELMGHSDLKMTLRYAHLAPEHKAMAVNLIG